MQSRGGYFLLNKLFFFFSSNLLIVLDSISRFGSPWTSKKLKLNRGTYIQKEACITDKNVIRGIVNGFFFVCFFFFHWENRASLDRTLFSVVQLFKIKNVLVDFSCRKWVPDGSHGLFHVIQVDFVSSTSQEYREACEGGTVYSR